MRNKPVVAHKRRRTVWSPFGMVSMKATIRRTTARWN